MIYKIVCKDGTSYTVGEELSEIKSKSRKVESITSELGDPTMGVPLCFVVLLSDEVKIEIFDYARVFYREESK